MLTRARRHLYVLSLILGLTTSGVALGGKPAPPPPPPACTDAFPSFAYRRVPTRQTLPAIVLASADGCRREVVRESPNLRDHRLHLTADRKAGVVLWTEEPSSGRYTVYWRKFSIDTTGALQLLGTAPTMLDLNVPGDPPLSAGEQLFYFGPSLWGNADHSRLYLSIRRAHIEDDGRTDVKKALRIYEFVNGSPNYVDFKVLLETPNNDSWADCTGVASPQFVAACYGAPSAAWNPTGTRLYSTDDADGWQALVRIDVINRDGGGALLPLNAWSFAAPALVFAGLRSGSTAQYYEPTGGLIRPKANPSDPEFTTLSYIARAGQQSFRVNAVLNADLCIQTYIYTPPSDSLWLQCVDTSFYTSHVERPEAWQTPDAVIDRVISSKGSSSLYRRYVAGSQAGMSVLLVEGAFMAVTAF